MDLFVVGRVWWAYICPTQNNMLIGWKHSFVEFQDHYIIRSKVNNLYEILKRSSHQNQNPTTPPSMVA